MGTNFPEGNGVSGSAEPKLKRLQSASARNSRIPHIGKKRHPGDSEGMGAPLKVTYQNLSASVKYYPSDGLFHAYWNIGGIKGKAASKTLEGAEAKAKERLRQIHQGRGQLSELSNREVASLNAALTLLLEAGHPDFLKVATEYLAAKEAGQGVSLIEMAQSHAQRSRNVEAASFKSAARDWFKTSKGRWRKKTCDNHRGRMEMLVTTFSSYDTSGENALGFEVIRFLLNESLAKKSPKWRNHVRETLRQIVNHCVARKWMPKDHGLESLLRNERDNPAPPKIITPEKFLEVLEACPSELLPFVVMMGLCGVRREETYKMTWEDVWETEGCIVVNARDAKMWRRRVFERPPVANEWLAPYRHLIGPIWKHTEGAFNSRLDAFRQTVGLKNKHNVLRHSFGSYRYALTDNADKTSKEMGNSPTTLKKSYYRLVTPAQGAEWFNLMPSTTTDKIVSII